MSRPREAVRAGRRLSARATLDRVAPALAILRTKIRDGDGQLTIEEASILLSDLLSEMDALCHDPAALSDLADVADFDPSAAAMVTNARASTTIANAAAARAATEEIVHKAGEAKTAALLEMIVAAARPSTVPAYAEALLDDMLAAGLTKNGLTAAQRNGVLAIVGNPNYGKNKIAVTPSAPAKPQPIVAASWEDLPDPVPGFRFERDRFSQQVQNRAVLDAGLPPGTSIDFFVRGGSLALANIESNRDKANFVWRSIKEWLAATGTSDPQFDNHRRPAWVFLLGHVHGFLANVDKINNVRFASPWVAGEVIIATRVVEQPDED